LAARLLYMLPLLAAAALLPIIPDRAFPAGASMAILAAYARLAGLAARGDSFEEGLLYAEALPFFAYAAAAYGWQSATGVLLSCAEAAVACAALLSLEDVLTRKRGVAETLVFMALLGALGFAMENVAASYIIGSGLLVLVATRYAASSRRGFSEPKSGRGSLSEPRSGGGSP
jgi:hypothetical protein